MGGDEPDPDDASEEVRVRADLFRLLLAGHRELARRSAVAAGSPLATRFGRLLGDFASTRSRAAAAGRDRSRADARGFAALLGGFADARELRRARQEGVADRFNLLDVLRLTFNEVRHSMVLAWLLDHDMDRLGTHAQGPAGFRLFLAEFGLPARYADGPYRVRREVAGDESIVDVEVAARGRFLIHVENKLLAAEGVDQTDREWADIRRRAAELGIDPDAADAPVHALFLTPAGARPANPNFVPVSWRRVVRVLEAFAEQARPADVRLFARHYAKAVRAFASSHETTQPGSDDDVEPTAR
ncbi:MAG: hypothetical protein JWO31_3553 [Phycisphaerales bacterium]|nr:hypothetical protein [Phycisphaerales bacterium]